MANKKRDKSTYIKKLGCYRLRRKDLLVIEKILLTYADFKEMKGEGISKMPEGRRHMPRKFIDRYASIGTYSPFYIAFGRWYFGINYAGVDWIYQEDSVKFLSKSGHPKKTRYLELSAKPGIRVTFTPLSTTIYAQTHNAAGRERQLLKDVSDRLEEYIKGLPTARLNYCHLA